MSFNTTQIFFTVVFFGFLALAWFAGYMSGQKKLRANIGGDSNGSK